MGSGGNVMKKRIHLYNIVIVMVFILIFYLINRYQGTSEQTRRLTESYPKMTKESALR